jgi:hypothetical protein
MIRYRTRLDEIESFEILRETDKMVFTKRGRENKRSDFHNWHDSWDDAKKFLVAQAEIRVIKARATLDRENEALQKIIRMQEN